jgi:hypothetical protein
MLFEPIKLPIGQRVLQHDESMSGEHVALIQVSTRLFAVCSVTPLGYVEDHVFGQELQSKGRYEARLTCH